MQLNPWCSAPVKHPVLDQGCVNRRGSSTHQPTRCQHLGTAAAAALGHTEGMAYFYAAGTDVPSEDDAGPPSWSSTPCRDITCSSETSPTSERHTHKHTRHTPLPEHQIPYGTSPHNPPAQPLFWLFPVEKTQPGEPHSTAVAHGCALQARTNQGHSTAQLCGMRHTIPCPSPATQHRLSLQAAQCGAGWAAAGSRRARQRAAASRNQRGAPPPPAVKNGAWRGPPAGLWAAKPSTRP